MLLNQTLCGASEKKRSWHRRFSVNVTKFLRTPFLQNTSGGCSCKELMKFNCCLSSIITGSYVKQGPNLSRKLFLSSFYSLQFLLLQDKIFIALISNQRWMHENLNGNVTNILKIYITKFCVGCSLIIGKKI